LRPYFTPLIGHHQAVNGAVALATMDKVRAAGFTVSYTAEQQGLARVNWPGRFEVVGRAPYVILDSAHNAESAERVAALIKALFAGQPITLLFGAFTDKDVSGMFRALLPLTQTLILMRARSPRAFEAETLADKAIASGFTNPLITATTADHAYKLAHDMTPPDGVILATGSTTIVGELRDILGLPPIQAAYLGAPAAPATRAAGATTGEVEGKTSR
jgi:dihydrofolate synthase/folylpolyglutamate synthase